MGSSRGEECRKDFGEEHKPPPLPSHFTHKYIQARHHLSRNWKGGAHLNIYTRHKHTQSDNVVTAAGGAAEGAFCAVCQFPAFCHSVALCVKVEPPESS